MRRTHRLTRHLTVLAVALATVLGCMQAPAQAAVAPCGNIGTPTGRLCALLYADVASFAAPGISKSAVYGTSGAWTYTSGRGYYTTNDQVNPSVSTVKGTVAGYSNVPIVVDGGRYSSTRASALAYFRIGYTVSGQARSRLFMYNLDITYGGSSNAGQLVVEDYPCAATARCSKSKVTCWSTSTAAKATSSGMTVKVVLPIHVTTGTSYCSKLVANGTHTVQATFASSGPTTWSSTWAVGSARTVIRGRVDLNADKSQLVMRSGI
ncbi:MAG: hypothetical protein QOE05_3784 [Actinomycetota bacterium]|jgi:hypothetical protein|nr:hypothetical protein [Actinomycetota bacterium]